MGSPWISWVLRCSEVLHRVWGQEGCCDGGPICWSLRWAMSSRAPSERMQAPLEVAWEEDLSSTDVIRHRIWSHKLKDRLNGIWQHFLRNAMFLLHKFAFTIFTVTWELTMTRFSIVLDFPSRTITCSWAQLLSLDTGDPVGVGALQWVNGCHNGPFNGPFNGCHHGPSREALLPKPPGTSQIVASAVGLQP